MKITIKQLRALIREKIDTGPFKKGDRVFFGKYKNKKGKIVDTYQDEKDHTAITIEPVPKGRKKDVEMGLYKVWPDDSPEEKQD